MKIRYLSVFGHPTYLRYRPKRYRCEYCDGQPTTSQRLDWHEPNSPHTFAYEQHVLLQLVNTTVEDVSRKERLTYDMVLGIVDRHIRVEVDWSQYKALDTLGIDEIALKKGHRDYVVILTARLKNGRVVLLGVLENRQKETVAEYLRSIPQRLKRSIVSACCDMYEGYTETIREELPHVRLVIDTRPIRNLKGDAILRSSAYESLLEARERKQDVPVIPEHTADFIFIRYIGHPQLAYNTAFLDEWTDYLASQLREGTDTHIFCYSPDNLIAPYLCRELHQRIATKVKIPGLSWDDMDATTLQQGRLF